MARSPHELTIRILNADRGGSASSSDSVERGGKSVISAIEMIKHSVVAREISTVTRQAVSFAVSNISLTTGNNVSQERIEFGLNAAGKLAAYGTALFTGNFVAAGIMALNDTITTVMNTERIRLANAVERESLALSRDRAGIAFNHSRMGGAK